VSQRNGIKPSRESKSTATGQSGPGPIIFPCSK
jgi:hypothetical protein